MPVHALNHVNIRAPRALVAELKDFYESVVGLRAGWRPPFQSTGYWLYLGDVPAVHLVDDDGVAAATGARGPIIDHVSFTCSGLADAEALLQSRGIAFRRTTVPGTALVQLIMRDPAGNGVELQFQSVDA
ncbi:VOC family protein [Piscinibacter koreensis]|uniref:Diguanylate cyclase n=1 Tax=Piscinibacter koreensis TaxID=2742824 RepID=A0A7Y6TW82_9BURK|nr:VOC family protein [Schlegelella koreensis]NUZ05810.1 diguanylate cyclase [Schlegelella koreensis]